VLEAMYVDYFKVALGESIFPFELDEREMNERREELMVGICEIDEDDINFRIVST
jgi:hypothetical protein